MRVQKEIIFEAAHRLKFHRGACKNLHGHSYKLVVQVESDVENRGEIRRPEEEGMTVDFGILSKIMKGIINDGVFCDDSIAPFDHALILKHDDQLIEDLEKYGFRINKMDEEPTAENMAYLFMRLIKMSLKFQNRDDVKVVQVDVWETKTSRATWRIEDGI